MLDLFKTARLYLAGKWGLKRRVLAGPDVSKLFDDEKTFWREFDEQLDRDYYTATMASELATKIAELKRNKKKHSHLQKQLDDLIAGGTDNASKTENTK